MYQRMTLNFPVLGLQQCVTMCGCAVLGMESRTSCTWANIWAPKPRAWPHNWFSRMESLSLSTSDWHLLGRGKGVVLCIPGYLSVPPPLSVRVVPHSQDEDQSVPRYWYTLPAWGRGKIICWEPRFEEHSYLFPLIFLNVLVTLVTP